MVSGMDDDSLVSPDREARARLARGTTPNAMAGGEPRAGSEPGADQAAQTATDSEPARSIREAVERLVSAREADDDAVAEWARGER